MRSAFVFGFFSIFFFMAVVWATITYQLQGNGGFLTGVLVAGTSIWVVGVVIWYALWIR